MPPASSLGPSKLVLIIWRPHREGRERLIDGELLMADFLISRTPGAWAGVVPKAFNLGCGKVLLLITFLQTDPPEVPAHSPGTQHPKVWSLT